MRDFTIDLDLARDLPKVRRAYARLVKRVGQCSYSAPCAIGAMMTPAERKKLERRFDEGTPIDTLIKRGVVVVPTHQKRDFLSLQEAFDGGDCEKFEDTLDRVENKYLARVPA